MATATHTTGAEQIRWDLTDLYAGPDDPQLDADLARARTDAAAFRERYHGKVGSLDATGLAEAVREGERIASVAYRAASYVSLHYATDTTDPARGALAQRVQEVGTQLETELLFFDLEWLAVDDERAERLLAAPELAAYRHHLASQRRYRPHVLSEAEEKILAEKRLTGAAAWTRLFEELSAAMVVRVGDEDLSFEQAMALLQQPDRVQRKAAAEGITSTLSDGLRTRAHIFNTLLVDKATDDRLRGYSSWMASRNLSNEASDESVDALVEAVVSRYDIPHRYYALKARLLGLDKLTDYDRMAPVTGSSRFTPWEEARDLVVGAYTDFSPKTGAIIGDFFDRSWIDAAISPGKVPGAFCATTIPGVHPYVLMSYTGERRAVLTLAHELGHGLHGVLASGQTLFNAETTLTLAETASVFGEALTFQRLLGSESDPSERLSLLVGRLDDTIATVFRQIAMNRFEDRMHTARRESGELSVDDLSEMWVDTQSAVLGPHVELTDNYRTWWSYIPHFLRTPGYVYAYAFGYLFSLAIFRRYQEQGDAMVEPYMNLLAAGGSQEPERLAEIVGLDLRDPGFWAGGLATVDAVLGEAEALAETVTVRS